MQSLTLITHKNIDLNSLINTVNKKYNNAWAVNEHNTTYSHGIDFFETIEKTEIWINDYKESEGSDKRFIEDLNCTNLITMNFSDFQLAKNILRLILEKAIKNQECIWVDNDYGFILNGQDALTCIQNDPEWDWRREQFPEIKKCFPSNSTLNNSTKN